MNEAILFKVLDLAFHAAALGLERQAIVDRVRGLEEAGAKPEEIIRALEKMRDDALNGAQSAIDQA